MNKKLLKKNKKNCNSNCNKFKKTKNLKIYLKTNLFSKVDCLKLYLFLVDLYIYDKNYDFNL